jgi:hypothetical protein
VEDHRQADRQRAEQKQWGQKAHAKLAMAL